jgi:DNA polymerase-3 subunit gamma/tau
VKPVAFKTLATIGFKEKTIKDFKENANISEAAPNKKNNGETGENNAKLIIEEKVIKPIIPKASAGNTILTNGSSHTKIGRLEKIQKQVALENRQRGNHNKQLNEEELYAAWGLYIEKLRKNNNHSGVTNFKSAKLNIIDSNCIEIITDNNIQQKFIETERAALIEHLRAHFNNRFLTYRVFIIENKNNNAVEEKHLTTKEQYLKTIEEYPLVKQLKDRLGLQLDY